MYAILVCGFTGLYVTPIEPAPLPSSVIVAGGTNVKAAVSPRKAIVTLAPGILAPVRFMVVLV